MYSFSILLIGFSIFSSMVIILTHFQCHHYQEQKQSRLTGIALLIVLIVIQLFHFKYLQGELQSIHYWVYHALLFADWIFTTPTVIFQPISGIWMTQLAGIPLTTPWVLISLILYVIAGCCWLPVVWLQIRMRILSGDALKNQTSLTAEYWRYTKIWFCLGIPAFIAMVLIVLLMVFKRI